MFKTKLILGLLGISSLLLLQGCEDESLEKCKHSVSDENKRSLALSYCEQSARQGSPEGQALFAELLIEQKDYEQAVGLLEKSANRLNPQALFHLGELYATGKGVDKDLNKAKFYYRYSCEQKFIKGCERENSLQVKDKQDAKQLAEQEAFEQRKRAEEARLAKEKQVFEEQKLAEERRKLAEERAEFEKQKSELAQQAKQMQNKPAQENKPTDPNPNDFYDGLAKFKENGLWGFIDRSGNVVIRPQFTNAGRFSHSRAAVQSPYTKLWGFIDTKGNYVISPNYCMLGAFSGSDGLAGVYQNGRMENGKCVGGKWGFMDTHGTWVINPILDYAERFISGKAKVIYNGTTGYINRNGQWVD